MSEKDFWEGYVPEPVKSGEGASATVTITLPAQQALDKKAENARELGLDYEPAQYSDIVSDGGLDPRNKFDKPAQQEPIAWRVKWPAFGGGYKWVMVDKPTMVDAGFVNEALYTSPPAQPVQDNPRPRQQHD
jgi:hypothetical protein